MADKLDLQHFKDKVANEYLKEKNIVDTTGAGQFHMLGTVYGFGSHIYNDSFNESAERYANYLAGEAWEEACSAQKKICSDCAFLDCDCDSWERCHGKVDILSILDAPIADNPYKQND